MRWLSGGEAGCTCGRSRSGGSYRSNGWVAAFGDGSIFSEFDFEVAAFTAEFDFVFDLAVFGFAIDVSNFFFAAELHGLLLNGGREIFPLGADGNSAASGLSRGGCADAGGWLTWARSGATEGAGFGNQSAILSDVDFCILAIFFELDFPDGATGAGFAVDVGNFSSAGLFADGFLNWLRKIFEAVIRDEVTKALRQSIGRRCWGTWAGCRRRRCLW